MKVIKGVIKDRNKFLVWLEKTKDVNVTFEYDKTQDDIKAWCFWIFMHKLRQGDNKQSFFFLHKEKNVFTYVNLFK